MIELIVLFGLAGIAILGFLVILGIVKVLFKVALIPIALAFGLLKVVAGLIVGVFLLTLGLPLLILALVLAPLVLLAGLVFGGFSVLAAVF